MTPEVGARVRVCHSDGYWYYGTLTSNEEKKGKFCVAFDDGDDVFVALPHRDIQVLASGAHGTMAGDTPEQAAFHGSFKKRRAKQQVDRYAADAAQVRGGEDKGREPAAKTAATMPPKGGPGYLQLALDALETLGTATWPKLTKWIESERPEVDFKPHLLKAALKKAVEKGAPPLCHRSARARCTRRRRIACRDTSVAPRCGLGCTRLHDSACRRAHRDRILRPRHACAAPRVPLLSRPLFSHRHHQTGQEPLYTL